MTVCPIHACYTHIGVDRTICRCGAQVLRDHPTGPATHAYIDGRVVFMRRSNCSREAESRFAGQRAVPSEMTALRQTVAAA